MEYDRGALIELVKKHAVSFGDFTLASGKKSSYYIDCRKVTLSSEGAALIGAGMLEDLHGIPFEAVGGLTLGADPILSAVLTLAGQEGKHLRGFIVRKEAKSHGTGKRVEGSVLSGDRVVIVEDVATSGASCVQAIEAAEAMGCTVVHVACVLDRLAGARELFAERGYAFSSLLTIRDLGLETI